MTIVTCSECGQSVSENAYICPNCGAPVNESSSALAYTLFANAPKPTTPGRGLAVGGLIVGFIGAVLSGALSAAVFNADTLVRYVQHSLLGLQDVLTGKKYFFMQIYCIGFQAVACGAVALAFGFAAKKQGLKIGASTASAVLGAFVLAVSIGAVVAVWIIIA